MPILSRVGNDFRFGLKFAALKAMRKLKAGAKEIIIEDIPMRRHDLQQLTTRVIGTGVKLKTLRLQGCAAGKRGARMVANMMMRDMRTACLEILSLPRNNLCDLGTCSIVGALNQAPYLHTLRTIQLAENGLTAATIAALASFVARSTALITLDLACNECRDDGAQVLGRGDGGCRAHACLVH